MRESFNIHLKTNDIFFAILILLSMVLVLWHTYGMNHRLSINPIAHEPYLFNDNNYGGTSLGELSITETSVDMSCDTELTELTFPFCSVFIPLLPESETTGLDLSIYDEVHLELEFSGSQRDTVLVYLLNDETTSDSSLIRRANMFVLTPNNEKITYQIPMNEFHLPSWWIFDHLELLDDFETSFNNIKRLQISTGDNRETRHIEISVHSIELHGKWIGRIELYTLIISSWFIYFVMLISFKVIQLTKTQKAASSKAKKLNELNHLLQLEKDKYESMAMIDPLTKAFNRAGMHEPMSEIINQYQKQRLPCALILFDIDHFKIINDTYGHDIGDHVLMALCQLVRANIRSNTTLARWGGEEFILLCPDTTIFQAEKLAENLRHLIESNMFIENHTVTCSFGMARYRGQKLDEWFKQADHKLYKAKNSGRNRVIF